MRIVDPETAAPKPEGEIGEIWLAGASVAGGYWERPVENEAIFGARLAGSDDDLRYLRTGDLGFVRDDELFIAGRMKDLIIIDGRNHYPQDIEQTVEGANIALSENGAAAFSVEVDCEERLIVVAELQREHMPGRRGATPLTEIYEAARRAVAEEHAVASVGTGVDQARPPAKNHQRQGAEAGDGPGV